MPFARSDLAYVAVSDAHGGCGQSHSRPVVNGAPVKVWEVSGCSCTDFLNSDPLWSSTISEVPETYDEELARKDFEKRGAKDKDAIMTLALARLAGVDPDLLPDSLTRMISGAKAHVPQTANCPAGHPNPLDQRFCGQCGQSLSAPAAAPELPDVTITKEDAAAALRASLAEVAVTAPPATPSAPQKPAPFSLPSNTKMRGMKREELGVLAGKAGVDAGGTRAELLERLIAANNGGKAG